MTDAALAPNLATARRIQRLVSRTERVLVAIEKGPTGTRADELQAELRRNVATLQDYQFRLPEVLRVLELARIGAPQDEQKKLSELQVSVGSASWVGTGASKGR